MKILLVLFFILQTAIAEQNYNLRIVDIIEPESKTDNYLVLASDGRVYKLDRFDNSLKNLAYRAMNKELVVKFESIIATNSKGFLETRNRILDIVFTTPKDDLKSDNISNKERFSPTQSSRDYVSEISSLDQLNEIFYNQRTDVTNRSQCYNRSHVWSWEMELSMNNGRRIQPGKVWLFFTKKYIREYNYGWWFHSVPYLTHNEDIRVMDKSFARSPLDLRTWTNDFVYSEQECPIIKKYSQYEDNPNTGHCFVQLSSVHYWQPYQLKKLEDEGVRQVEWTQYSLKKFYRNAIGIFSRVPRRD